MLRTHLLISSLLGVMVITGFSTQASADSFLTSVSTGSRTAARSRNALSTIRNTKNVAIGFDAIQNIGGKAQYQQFRKGMNKLIKQTTDPATKAKFQLLLGTALLHQRANNPWALRTVNTVLKAATRLSNDSAAQLVAGLAVAQYEGFNQKLGHQWEKPTALKWLIASKINLATALESSTKHPRPLVQSGLKEAKDYINLYEGYAGMIK